MRAAWYENRGRAREVLRVGEMETPVPGPGEVRIRVEFSGINTGDVKKRQVWLGAGAMAHPRIVPHNDGAGVVDAAGEGVPRSWLGRRVWCSYAQSYRPYGTAAQYTVVPVRHVGALPQEVPAEQGACLGIPGLTAHRAVFADGPVAGTTVLVAGAAGSVGRAASALARRGGARVIGTVTRADQLDAVREGGADHALRTGPHLAAAVLELTGGRGADRVIEVALDANVHADADLLAPGGAVVTYATGDPEPALPFWPLAFKNATVRLLGYDDFPPKAVAAGIAEVTAAAAAGDLRYPIAGVFPLTDIAAAHEAVERPQKPGRVLLALPDGRQAGQELSA
ncbi:NADPH:quinone reductase [Streptomyces sp. MST-110588]|uniref:NADPH:quinone reductase n=1 Tax=Streptomyces sp. MST-110588 TaxID=2833628 RepID=UPI001F5DAA0B|nr:NADPH:quinone reductase [Streptomyces sp. MST-110588]UNO43191.1 NADPH:quinone reductase [Streptomyces sp. MST-110588]